jgi:hypothetical protein
MGTKETPAPDVREAYPGLPNFDHLQKVETFGALNGIHDLLERSITRFVHEDRTQVIAFTGLQGSGKSTRTKLAIQFLEARFASKKIHPDIKLVNYDDALNISGVLKQKFPASKPLSKFNPDHASGRRTKSDYRGATFIFGNAIRMAVAEGGIVVVEAPAVGGFKLDEGGYLGKDRGTTALRMLIKGEGYEGMTYDASIAAIVASPNLYVENLRSRSLETDEQVANRPGATMHGTVKAIREMRQVLLEIYSNPGFKLTRRKISRDIVSMTLVVERDLFPWILEKYLKVSPERGIILENELEDIAPVINDDFEPYSYIKHIPEDRYKELLKVKL